MISNRQKIYVRINQCSQNALIYEDMEEKKCGCIQINFF